MASDLNQWIVDRPFYWSNGVERITNGRWTIELIGCNSGQNLHPMISVEHPYGRNDYIWPNEDGTFTYDVYLPPKYVVKRALRLAKEVWFNH